MTIDIDIELNGYDDETGATIDNRVDCLRGSIFAFYCRLCHEHRIKSVRVDKETAGAIKRISGGVRAEYLGIKFKQR